MIQEQLIELLNVRITNERASAYLYLAMSRYLTDIGMNGAGKLWYKFYEEEEEHSEWASHFLLSFGIRPETRIIPGQPLNFDGVRDVVQQTYDHEVDVTHQCNELACEAMKLENFNVFALAQRYNSEQIEEMNKVTDLVDQLNLFGDSGASLKLFDKYCAKMV